MDQLYQQAVLIAPRTHYPATTDDCGGHEREPVGVHIHSGADGSLLGTVTGDGPEQLLGYSVDSACDINNDGRDDLFMGSPALLTFRSGLRCMGDPTTCLKSTTRRRRCGRRSGSWTAAN